MIKRTTGRRRLLTPALLLLLTAVAGATEGVEATAPAAAVVVSAPEMMVEEALAVQQQQEDAALVVQPEKVSQEPEAQEKEAEAAATTTPFLRGSVKATDDASTDGLGEGEEGDDVFFLFVPSFLRRPFFLSPPSITVVGGPGPSSLPLAAEGQVHEQGAGEVEDSGDSNNSDFFFPSFLRPDAIPFPALVQEWFFGNGGPLSPSDSAMEGPSSSSSSVVFVSDDGQGGSKVVVIQDGEEVAMPVVQQEDDVQLQAAQQQQQKENEAQTQERKQHALLLLLGAAVGAAFMLLGVFGAAIFNGGLRGVDTNVDGAAAEPLLYSAPAATLALEEDEEEGSGMQQQE